MSGSKQPLQLIDGALNSQVIYDAINDEEAYAGLSSLIGDFMSARSSTILRFEPHGTTNFLSSHYFSPEMMKDYVDNYNSHDLWSNFAFKNKNLILNTNDVVSPVVFENSVIFNEFFRKYGDDTFYCAGGVFDSDIGGVGLVGFHRGRSAGAFTAEETSRLKHVMPHLNTVISVRERIAGRDRTLKIAKALLDAIAVAALVVTRDGRLVDLNAPAERILKAEDGLKLRQGTVRSADGRLGVAIRLATARLTPQASAVALDRATSPSPRLASVVPLEGALAAILFQDDGPAGASVEALLRQMFDLTPSEAAVAVLLHNGLTREEIEARRGVTGNTLRTQVKALMSKMGCRRQSEVMATVARLSVWSGAGADRGT